MQVYGNTSLFLSNGAARVRGQFYLDENWCILKINSSSRWKLRVVISIGFEDTTSRTRSISNHVDSNNEQEVRYAFETVVVIANLAFWELNIFNTLRLFVLQGTCPTPVFVADARKGKGRTCPCFAFPAHERKRKQWLEAFNIAEGDITEHSRICSRHFLHGDPSNPPSLDLGKRFASPKKVSTERGMKAIKRASLSPSLSVTATKVKHYPSLVPRPIPSGN